MKSIKYWAKRENAHRKRLAGQERNVMVQIEQEYQRAIKAIEDEILREYAAYTKGQNVTMEEMMKQVAKMDVQRFNKKAAKYVKDRDFSNKANKELKIYNMKMRVNRLQYLKAQIELEFDHLTYTIEQAIDKQLNQVAVQEYKRQAGILGDSIQFSPKDVENIVNGSFKLPSFKKDDGTFKTTFSDRIWINQENTRNALNIALNKVILQGVHPFRMIDIIKGTTKDATTYQAKRILITETARIQADIQTDCYNKAGFDWYLFIAEPKACPICGALDGRHFKVDEQQIGKNMFPMHPNCRCSTAPFVPDEEYEKLFGKEYTDKRRMERLRDLAWAKNEKDRHKKAKDGIIDIMIDKFTPCLQNRETGEIIRTEYKKTSITTSKAKQLKKQGWNFDWSRPERDGFDVYQLTLEKSKEIQGLIAMKDEPGFVKVELAESAPRNIGRQGQYEGIGGHLFAIAVERSFSRGYDGYVLMVAKTNLIEHYKRELGAKIIGRQQMIIDSVAAQKLFDKYIKK